LIMASPVLKTEGLTRHFGGLSAVEGVSLDVNFGEVLAIIGPNGAGKTTLVNMLSGDLTPTSGAILLHDRNITGLRPDQIAHLGVGRSYQRTNIFWDFSALDNARLAAQSRLLNAMRFFRPARRYVEVTRAAEKALSQVGLAARTLTIARELSHGEQRQLEIAMTLAMEPEILLLDEPLAGMGAEESASMVQLIKKLRPSHAIVLVEHDMDAVFAVADRLMVIVNGRVLESGSPSSIRANAEVQRAYLGDESPDE
jgi:branched-chain amino acid transport system ATP-binding protein